MSATGQPIPRPWRVELRVAQHPSGSGGWDWIVIHPLFVVTERSCAALAASFMFEHIKAFDPDNRLIFDYSGVGLAILALEFREGKA